MSKKIPAYKNIKNGEIYICKLNDGSIAPFHTIQGFPEELVKTKDKYGCVETLKVQLIEGYMEEGKFVKKN